MEKPKKNKPYMMYLKQSLSAVRPQYQVYRDGMNVVYTIEGDVTRHRFSVRQGEREVLMLHKKIAKLFAEYTIEKDGQEIAQIKMPDLNAANLDSATEMIKGTARSMGIVVEG